MFLLWPLVLAVLMVNTYWSNLPAVLAYVAIVLTVCVTTATVALFCSVMCHKTSISLMTTYLLIVVLFAMPLAIRFFAATFFPDAAATRWIDALSFTSPFAVAFHLPIDTMMPGGKAVDVEWVFLALFVGFYAALDGVFLAVMGGRLRSLADGLTARASTRHLSASRL